MDLRRGYNKKYKNGKYDTKGQLNGKWRIRPSLNDIIKFIQDYAENIQNINTLVQLSKHIGFHTTIIKEVIESNGYSVNEFLNQYIGFKKGRPNDIKYDFFVSVRKKYKNTHQFIKENGISYKGYKSIINYTNKQILNHKVFKIEVLSIKRDTCDITIEKYHNFATEAGIIIHNSEDVRFARTIQRLQRIITSELSKIAIVHLYAQGYRDESLVDFELELTNPSTIFEKEKVEIWSDKVSVSTDMVENKFFSYNWVYKNVFNMSEDDIETVRNEIIEDTKQRYRFKCIEEDGDDPAKPFQKIGDGHKEGEEGGGLGGLGGGGGGGGGLGDLGDLSDLEGGEEGEEEKGNEEEGEEGGEEEKLPELKEYHDPKSHHAEDEDRDQSGEHKSDIMNDDPLGQHAMHETPKSNSEGKKKSEITHNFDKRSPLSIRELNRPPVNKTMINSLSEFLLKPQTEIKQELLMEDKTLNSTKSKSLMDESNIFE